MSSAPGPPKSMTLTFQAFAPTDRPPPPESSPATFTSQADHAHIPRPPNAFMIFRSSFIRNHAVPDSVEANHSNLSKIAGLVWNSLSASEREKWEEKAREAQAHHRRMYPDWRFRPGFDKGAGQGAVKKAKLAKPRTNDDDADSGDKDLPSSDQALKIEFAGTGRTVRGRGRRATISTSSSSTRSSTSSKPKGKPGPKSFQTNVDKEFENARIQKIAQLLASGQRGEELEESLAVWVTHKNDSDAPDETSKPSGSRGRPLSCRTSPSPIQNSGPPSASPTSEPDPLSQSAMFKRSNSVPANHHRPPNTSISCEETQWPSFSERLETHAENAHQIDESLPTSSRSQTPLAVSPWPYLSASEVPPSPAISLSSSGFTDSYSSFPNSPVSLHASPALPSAPVAYSSSPERQNHSSQTKPTPPAQEYSSNNQAGSLNWQDPGPSSSQMRAQAIRLWNRDDILQYHQELHGDAWWSQDQSSTEQKSMWPSRNGSGDYSTSWWSNSNSNHGGPSSISDMPRQPEADEDFQHGPWYQPMSINSANSTQIPSSWQPSSVVERSPNTTGYPPAFQDSSSGNQIDYSRPPSPAFYPTYYSQIGTNQASTSHAHSPVSSSYSSLAGWAGDPAPSMVPASSSSNIPEQCQSEKEPWMPSSRWEHSIQHRGFISRNIMSKDSLNNLAS